VILPTTISIQEETLSEPVLVPESPVILPTEVVFEVPQPVLDEQSLLIELYKRVNPAVVNIIAFSDQASTLVGYSEGSGFVIDQDGNIVTNAHVVHGSDALEVTFSDASTRPAVLIGEDFNSDLAVVRVSDLPGGISPLVLGDDTKVLAGQTVVAIGNPFGFNGTMTRGIVSAIGRTIPALNTFSIPMAIQTDAPINPGNSGGPLLNLEGEVIGVNAQIRTESDVRANSGVGFAIPASILKRVIPSLVDKGEYIWSWLGVSGRDLDWATAAAMDLPVDRGAYISQVIENGPSSKAGLRGSERQTTYEGKVVDTGGDVIIAINDTPIHSFDDLLVYVALEANPGEEVSLTILRDGKEQEILLTLEPRPAELITPFSEDTSP